MSEPKYSLKDIVPKSSSFKLRLTGETFHLRPVTVEDEVWMAHTFGDEIEKVFMTMHMGDICRIVYRLIIEEDKKKLSRKKVKVMDENGEVMEMEKGGVELLRTLISGAEEKSNILNALLETIGLSRPFLEKIAGVEKKSPGKRR